MSRPVWWSPLLAHSTVETASCWSLLSIALRGVESLPVTKRKLRYQWRSDTILCDLKYNIRFFVSIVFYDSALVNTEYNHHHHITITITVFTVCEADRVACFLGVGLGFVHPQSQGSGLSGPSARPPGGRSELWQQRGRGLLGFVGRKNTVQRWEVKMFLWI